MTNGNPTRDEQQRHDTRRVVVTGCAGFLGSHLAERLVSEGKEVVGVDCFTDYYDRADKRRNLRRLMDDPRFMMLDLDLSQDPLEGLLEGVDVVYHLAAQAGVRGSFGKGFHDYTRNNVTATQRLLDEAARWPLQSFTYASSSSVYGDAERHPTSEDCPRRPVSPYGMTKVATEELAGVYHRTMGVPTVGLRYFTVYGPRQRPDMAFRRFLERAVEGESLPINGDGRQVRDFTFVHDVVAATMAAAERGHAGTVYNVGGGSPVELREAVAIIGELTGREIRTNRRDAQTGDARKTSCDGTLSREHLGFVPQTSLREGLAAELEWLLARNHGRRFRPASRAGREVSHGVRERVRIG